MTYPAPRRAGGSWHFLRHLEFPRRVSNCRRSHVGWAGGGGGGSGTVLDWQADYGFRLFNRICPDDLNGAHVQHSVWLLNIYSQYNSERRT